MIIQPFQKLGQLTAREVAERPPKLSTTNIYEAAYYLLGHCYAHAAIIEYRYRNGQVHYHVTGPDFAKLHHAYHNTNGQKSITYEPVNQFIKNINELSAITNALVNQNRPETRKLTWIEPNNICVDIPKGYDVIFREYAVEEYQELKESLGLADPKPTPDVSEDINNTDHEQTLRVADGSESGHNKLLFDHAARGVHDVNEL